jgi:hypothetical protein
MVRRSIRETRRHKRERRPQAPFSTIPYARDLMQRKAHQATSC